MPSSTPPYWQTWRHNATQNSSLTKRFGEEIEAAPLKNIPNAPFSLLRADIRRLKGST